MPTVSRAAAAVALLGLMTLAAGCSGQVKRSKISGVVTYKGESLKGGNINISNDTGGSYSCAIESNGSYSISDIPPGTYAVVVETESLNPDTKAQAQPTGRNAKAGPGAAPAGVKDKMAKEYADRMGATGGGGGGNATQGPSREDLAKRFTKIPAKYSTKATSGLSVEIGNGEIKKDFPLAE